MNDDRTAMANPAAVLDTAPDQRLLLRIADITASVACDGSFNIGVEGEKEKFVVHEGVSDVSIRMFMGRLPEYPMGQRLFDAGTVWQLYQHNGSYLFTFSSLSFGSRPYKIAIFDQDFSNGEVYIHPDFFGPGQPVDPLWSPLDELLYINLLAKGKGVEIHACGLIDSEGLGYLFVGRSGAGKTTMARLWQNIPGVTILSDDRIILRKSDGKIWMYGTPWHGEGGMAVVSKAPLSRIYFLQKAENNELLPLKEAEAAARLTACSFPPYYNREAMDFTLGFFSEVVQDVPCYEIRVVPDKRVIEFISNQITVVN
jgi:hypothetical protein